jgi:hypothetical protein
LAGFWFWFLFFILHGFSPGVVCLSSFHKHAARALQGAMRQHAFAFLFFPFLSLTHSEVAMHPQMRAHMHPHASPHQLLSLLSIWLLPLA